jgi:two-component system, LuxR family, response regulator FixJ
MADGNHLVLLIDDDLAVREALQFALELEGLSVRVHNGSDGLLADPNLEHAGCVVLDDRNRGMDGFELLSRLRARNLAVPSIMLVDHLTARVRDRARAAGVDLILEKPLMDNALRDHIRRIMATGCASGTNCRRSGLPDHSRVNVIG